MKRLFACVLVSTLMLAVVPVSSWAEDEVFLTTPMVACGYNSTYAIKNDGTLWAWGGNGVGQLGDGTTVGHRSPVQVKTLSRVVSVSGGGWHAVALTDDGSVWTWGNNRIRQLGDGTLEMRTNPQRIREADSDELFNINPIVTKYSISISETALELRTPAPVRLSVAFHPVPAHRLLPFFGAAKECQHPQIQKTRLRMCRRVHTMKKQFSGRRRVV